MLEETFHKPEIINQFLENQEVGSIPELSRLRDTIENNGWHNNQDTLSHTQMVLNNLEIILGKANQTITTSLNQKNRSKDPF
jgi:hypothetical protein